MVSVVLIIHNGVTESCRRDCKEVTMSHFETAKDKVMMGPERKSMIISEDEKRNTAYHEAGHCIVAKMVPGADPVHKITIIPRGQALGVTILLPTEDRLSMSKEYAEGMIAYAMGGRAAEEIVFGHTTTGAGNDIQKATDIARKMVCNWGMSDKLGPIALGAGDGDPFLGRELGSHDRYSQNVLNDIDSEIKDLLTTAYDKAVNILTEKREILTEMSESLLIRETLESKDIDAIMKGEKIVTEDEKVAYQERLAKEKEEAQAAASEDTSAERSSEPETPSGVEPLPQGS